MVELAVAEEVPRDLIVVSYSEVQAGKKCPPEHKTGYRPRWNGTPTKAAARKPGTLFPQALGVYYHSIFKGDTSQDAIVRWETFLLDYGRRAHERERFDLAEQADLVAWMIRGYVEHWAAEDAERWEPLHIEYRDVVRISDRFALKIKIDLMMRDRMSGRIWAWDHKSNANLPTEAELDLEDQFPTYRAALRLRGFDIWACMYNCGRSQRNKKTPQPLNTRFARIGINHTDDELSTFLTEFIEICERLYSPRNLKHSPRHTDSERCRYRCDLTQPCLTGRKLGDQRMYRHLQDSGFVQDFTRH